MKQKDSLLAVIRSDDADEPNERESRYRDDDAHLTTDVVWTDDAHGRVLEWSSASVIFQGWNMLPRDFEMTLVPGPLDVQ